MKTQRVVLSLAVLIALSVLAGCASTPTTPEPVTAPPTATRQPAPQETAVAAEPPAATDASTPEPATKTPVETPAAGPVWVADGVIGADEYTDTADFGKIRLWWRHDGETLYFAMEGDTQGWVSVGIEPSRGMKDADFFFGFVANGEAKLWDAFGTAASGPNHPPDEELGGTNDLLEFAGVEDGNVTRFELKRRLDTGDQYDKALAPGATYNIIVATGGADDYNGYHSVVRSGQLTLRP